MGEKPVVIHLDKQLLVQQGLFWKVRACVQFFRKRAKKGQKMLKKGKIFGNLGKNVQNLKIF